MEKCCFYTAKECSATIYAVCPKNCAFRKTQEEYDAGIERAKEILKRKGLVKVEESIGRKKTIVTTIREDIDV